jgi:hypothetical protein
VVCLNKVLTVDPGLGTGWAYWTGNLKPETGVFKMKRKKTDGDEVILNTAIENFRQVLKKYEGRIDACHIEKMETWASSHKSMMATLRGDLMLVEGIAKSYGTLCAVSGIKYFYIKARQWKGQLPDDIVDLRIERVNGISYPQHISSAVGMGMSLMGIL